MMRICGIYGLLKTLILDGNHEIGTDPRQWLPKCGFSASVLMLQCGGADFAHTIGISLQFGQMVPFIFGITDKTLPPVYEMEPEPVWDEGYWKERKRLGEEGAPDINPPFTEVQGDQL